MPFRRTVKPKPSEADSQSKYTSKTYRWTENDLDLIKRLGVHWGGVVPLNDTDVIRLALRRTAIDEFCPGTVPPLPGQTVKAMRKKSEKSD